MNDFPTLHTGVAGYFKIVARRPDGSERVLADWFPNLITDAGLNTIGTLGYSSYLAYCRVGSGSTTPAVTDSALANHIAATGTQQALTLGGSGTSPYYGYVTKTFRFATGVAAGNLSEVGIATAATGGTLFSRALILDGGGSPTTITVLSDETLDVTYQLRFYSPTSDVTGNITISAVTYAYTIRAAQAGTASWQPTFNPPSTNNAAVYNGTLGAVTSVPSGTSSNSSAVSQAAYSNNSLRLDATITYGLNNGNLSGGVSAAVFSVGTIGYFQIGFSPSIPKDATKTLALTYRVTWARYTP